MFDSLFAERGLSLDRLRVLIEVHDAGSISQTAPGQSVKHSQYSRQLRELSEFFGCEVSERHGKVVRLTSDGARLAEITRTFLRAMEDFYTECRNDRTLFSIAAGDSLIQWLVIPRIAELLKKIDNCRFTTLSLRTFDLVKQLSDGRVDFGILRKNAVSPPLKCVALGTLNYVAVIPARLMPGKGTPTFTELFRNYPLAVQITDGQFTKQLQAVAYEQNSRFRPALACQSFPQTLAAVATGTFAAVVPELAVQDLPPQGFYKISAAPLKQLQRDIVLGWNPRVTKVRPHATKILTIMQKIFRF